MSTIPHREHLRLSGLQMPAPPDFFNTCDRQSATVGLSRHSVTILKGDSEVASSKSHQSPGMESFPGAGGPQQSSIWAFSANGAEVGYIFWPFPLQSLLESHTLCWSVTHFWGGVCLAQESLCDGTQLFSPRCCPVLSSTSLFCCFTNDRKQTQTAVPSAGPKDLHYSHSMISKNRLDLSLLRWSRTCAVFKHRLSHWMINRRVMVSFNLVWYVVPPETLLHNGLPMLFLQLPQWVVSRQL